MQGAFSSYDITWKKFFARAAWHAARYEMEWVEWKASAFHKDLLVLVP